MIYGGFDGVEEAGVVALVVAGADGFVDLGRVAASQLLDAGDVGSGQVAGYGRADVHEGRQVRGLHLSTVAQVAWVGLGRIGHVRQASFGQDRESRVVGFCQLLGVASRVTIRR